MTHDSRLEVRPGSVTPTTDARSAIELFTRSLDLPQARVLVPAYYGQSPREGSGVADAFDRAGAALVPYRVDRNLHIDVDDVRRRLREPVDLLMVVHYFGWPDPSLDEVLALADSHGVPVLEDEAHALLSDIVGGVCGRSGAAAAISVNKSFETSGGLLVVNDGRTDGTTAERLLQDVVGVDLVDEAGRRRADASAIIGLARERQLALLRDLVPDGVVPLNVPVLVPPHRRQPVYEAMHAAGYPVACLYYQLGPGIDRASFPDSQWLSDRLVNLPLRAAASSEELTTMVDLLVEVSAG